MQRAVVSLYLLSNALPNLAERDQAQESKCSYQHEDASAESAVHVEDSRERVGGRVHSETGITADEMADVHICAPACFRPPERPTRSQAPTRSSAAIDEPNLLEAFRTTMSLVDPLNVDRHSEFEDAADCPNQPPPRSLTFFNGLAIVIGLQIGSGIFSTPAFVATLVPNTVLAICVWAFAGLLVWTGAVSFAELGVRCPDNGGMQEYLCHCFGDLYGFLFACTWILVVKPCSMSMIAMIFAEYLDRGFAPDHANLSPWVIKAVALLAIILITCLNCMGTTKAAKTANVFLVLKLTALGTIVGLGFLAGIGTLKHRPSQENQESAQHMYSVDKRAINTTISLHSAHNDLKSATDATLAALFAFGGWESVGFIAGEVLDPINNIPMILNRAMLIVIVLFILTVTAFYKVLPLKTMQNTNALASVGS
ncbi:MAG: hypothetical protein Q9195_005037 [Heterodermia aff. obscurata]